MKTYFSQRNPVRKPWILACLTSFVGLLFVLDLFAYCEATVAVVQTHVRRCQFALLPGLLHAFCSSSLLHNNLVNTGSFFIADFIVNCLTWLLWCSRCDCSVCVCVVAVYQRPFVLQPSLPKYVCSFASLSAATASTNIMPCIPSSTVLESPLAPNVLWSPRTDVVKVVSSRAGLNCSTLQTGSELNVPHSPVMLRSRTCSDHCHNEPSPSIQPVLMSTASGGSTDCTSPTSVEDLVSQLVASLPVDVIKSNLSQYTAERLLDLIKTDNVVDVVDDNTLQMLSNYPQLASVVEELLASSRFEPKMTRPSIGRWKSLPGLLQQTENRTTVLSGLHDYLQSAVDVPSCQTVLRSLGQLGQAHQMEDQASSLHWYVFC